MSNVALVNSFQEKTVNARSAPEKKKWKREVTTLRKELVQREEVPILSGWQDVLFCFDSIILQRMICELLKSADVVLCTNSGASPEGPLKLVM